MKLTVLFFILKTDKHHQKNLIYIYMQLNLIHFIYNSFEPYNLAVGFSLH